MLLSLRCGLPSLLVQPHLAVLNFGGPAEGREEDVLDSPELLCDILGICEGRIMHYDLGVMSLIERLGVALKRG